MQTNDRLALKEITLQLKLENTVGDKVFVSIVGSSYNYKQCFNVLIDIYHEFLLLFYGCVLLEIKHTTILLLLLML